MQKKSTYLKADGVRLPMSLAAHCKEQITGQSHSVAYNSSWSSPYVLPIWLMEWHYVLATDRTTDLATDWAIDPFYAYKVSGNENEGEKPTWWWGEKEEEELPVGVDTAVVISVPCRGRSLTVPRCVDRIPGLEPYHLCCYDRLWLA